jgi:hypothetical protein
MRRKIWLASAATLVVAVAATSVAFAATSQVNTYTVTGKISGGKSASKKKPKPVAVNFDYTVGEEHNLRPSVVTKYSILFGGLSVNNTAFKGCNPSLLVKGGPGPSACPKASIMGSGAVHNSTGNSADPSDKDNPAFLCNLKLTTINSTKKNHFLLYLLGVPSDPDINQRCALPIGQAIDATFKKEKTGTSLNFSVPTILLHPLPTIDNSVVQVKSSIKKASVTKKGKKVGFFQSTSCPKGKQKISVTFTQEAGNVKKTASSTVSCK